MICIKNSQQLKLFNLKNNADFCCDQHLYSDKEGMWNISDCVASRYTTAPKIFGSTYRAESDATQGVMQVQIKPSLRSLCMQQGELWKRKRGELSASSSSQTKRWKRQWWAAQGSLNALCFLTIWELINVEAERDSVWNLSKLHEVLAHHSAIFRAWSCWAIISKQHS